MTRRSIDRVDLVICYELGVFSVDVYQIVDWRNSTAFRNSVEPFPFVGAVLLDTVTGREVQMLALQDVLDPDIVTEPPKLPEDVRDSDL